MTTFPALRLPKRVRDWFVSNEQTPLRFQREAWRAYAAGRSGLIYAPTGSGKTLAAALGPMLDAARSPASGRGVEPVRLLWITPLRALSVDTALQIQALVDGIGLKWTVGVRTGDTSSSERARQLRKLPSVLITTPESLALLLSYSGTSEQLRGVRSVVVDEWHELTSSKRGVQLQLCLAHLRAQKHLHGLQTWGLSATIGNLADAMTSLLGVDHDGVLIEGKIRRLHRIRTLIPLKLQNFPWAGHLGLSQVAAVAEAIEGARSTLVFTNTRAQAERWFEALSCARLDWLGQIALHHGSLDPKVRRSVEAMVRAGQLKCVVATSSLDLGVDFSPVDQVIQIGGSKGVSRLLQRAGRSGHQPGGASELLCVATNGMELVEFSAARAALKRGEIEERTSPVGSLDVLVQHLITLALASGVAPDQVCAQARSTAAFALLSDAEWQWVIDFVTSGGPALKAYDEYQRLRWDGDLLVPSNSRVIRRHRMSVGTIGSNATVRVVFQRGATLGSVEESFIARLNSGDVFLFAGRALELCHVRDLVATVKRATRARTLVPRWNGGRLALSSQLANAFLRELASFEEAGPTTPELKAASSMLRIQQRWSCLPTPDRLVVESQRFRRGYSVYVFPFAGRQANDGIAALMAWRLSQVRPSTVTFTANDYGLELYSQTALKFDEALIRTLLDPRNVEQDLTDASNLAELSKARFRDIARISGLVFQGYPGASKTSRQVQASSSLLFDVLTNYEPENALLKQAGREVLTEMFDLPRVQKCLLALVDQELCHMSPDRLTPFSMPLWADRQGAMLSTESWQDRVQLMLSELEAAGEQIATEVSGSPKRTQG